jgi:hypothetical protein
MDDEEDPQAGTETRRHMRWFTSWNSVSISLEHAAHRSRESDVVRRAHVRPQLFNSLYTNRKLGAPTRGPGRMTFIRKSRLLTSSFLQNLGFD